MELEFYKYQGAGNDFIIIDNRKKQFPTHLKGLIPKLCDRRFGIGSDGLILLDNDSESNFYMDFYNPDGSQSFCGNGSRCVVMFAFHLGLIPKVCTFRSIHGLNKAEIVDSDNVKLRMFDVSNIELIDKDYYLNTGSPHYNRFVDDVDRVNLIPMAREIRYNARFTAEGTNVNLIQKTNHGIKVRTYERGVEGETWSCGTGVTACAISYAIEQNEPSIENVDVEAKGGDLKIQFKTQDLKTFTDVYLIGPATFVYKGEIDV